MPRSRTVALVLFAAVACVQQKPVEKRPAANSSPTPGVEAVEELAFEAEREINAAEQALDNMEPDKAAEHLDVADTALSNKQIDRYPEAELLRSRHLELLGRVPKVREELRKKRLAEAIEKSKQKIEEAMATLRENVKVIRARDPDDTDLKLADEGVTRAKGAISDGEELESKDRDYSKYALKRRKQLDKLAGTVKSRRLQVEIGRSSSDLKARAKDVGAAMRPLKRRDPSEEDFADAKRATDALDESVKKADELADRNAKFARTVGKYRTLAKKTRERIEKREHQAAVARQKNLVQAKLTEMVLAVSGLSAKRIGEAEIAATTEAVDSLESVLKEGIELEQKDRGYRRYAASAREKASDTKKRVEKRKVDVAVQAQKDALKAALSDVKAALFDTPDAAKKAIDAANKALEAGVELEVKAKAYRKVAAAARKTLRDATNTIESAKQNAAFESDVVSALLAAQDTFATASEMEPVAQQKAFDEVIEKARGCKQAGAGAIASSPSLAKKRFDVGTKQMKATAILAECTRLAKTAEKKKKKIEAIVAVYEGPVAEHKAGKTKLDEARDAKEAPVRKRLYEEATKSFQECIGNGKILTHKYPELAKKKLDVDGEQLTLAKLVDACKDGAKTAKKAAALE